MKKKTLSIALALVLALSMFTVTASAAAVTASAASVTAKPTSSTVLVNGEKIDFDAYHINGNNFFKLRDLAYTLNDTDKQFEVEWDDANKAISLKSRNPYTEVGGEMESKGTGNKKATPTISKILLDDEEVSFTAFHIEGNNYFKLRDIGRAFDFSVEWDAANKIIAIDTSMPYTEETEDVDWKALYLAEMQAALEYAAGFEAGAPNPDHDWNASRYPEELTGFTIADLNFDGIPELIIYGDVASASEMMRIFTITNNEVVIIFIDWGNELTLYRKNSGGNPAYYFESANGENNSLSGSIYITNESTQMDGSFRETSKVADFATPYDDDDPQYVPVWIFNGNEVTESEFNDHMAGLLTGYAEASHAIASMSKRDDTFDAGGLEAFLDSYIPES